MKKLVLGLMSCGSLVIASGKVEFVNEVSSTPFCNK